MTFTEETEIALLKHEMQELKEEIKDLKTSVADLVNAWNTANSFVKFMKWLSGISVSAGVLYELVRHRI